MTIEILAFVFGCMLILVGLIGGGFEVKELKIPKVGWATRIAAVVCGVVFIAVGLTKVAGLSKEDTAQHAATQPAPTPEGRESSPPEQKAEEPAARPKPVVLGLAWLDNALIYKGHIEIYGRQAILHIKIFDRETREFIKSHSQEISSMPVDGGFVVSGLVSVPGDSVTPNPHNHQFNLVFTNNGNETTVKNCSGSNCYPAEVAP